ncbi:Metallo-beta-lactamase domain-containing protein 1 [Fasciolopsis buskii]|uniref:Metallo-beta-lactamase domain-containing protein 1 n=1 Tax=Fasciolopsis buskii TaxID=27845 RepID=A0A8E0VHD8_9TREM|nr:Metallo-beta-lactamase domain-containing protein 1 [Fasciolopsis buski]
MTDSGYQLHILRPGWSKRSGSDLYSGCTISLLTGPRNILVDPGSPWDTELVLRLLGEHDLRFGDIDYLVCTHEHVDHLGSMDRFTNAIHIIGTSIYKNQPIEHDFGSYIPYEIDSYISVVHTPGHTPHDVSVICENIAPYGCVAITGDLFECEADLNDPQIWQKSSWRKQIQVSFRLGILEKANLIVPGHGNAFQVSYNLLH